MNPGLLPAAWKWHGLTLFVKSVWNVLQRRKRTFRIATPRHATAMGVFSASCSRSGEVLVTPTCFTGISMNEAHGDEWPTGLHSLTPTSNTANPLSTSFHAPAAKLLEYWFVQENSVRVWPPQLFFAKFWWEIWPFSALKRDYLPLNDGTPNYWMALMFVYLCTTIGFLCQCTAVKWRKAVHWQTDQFFLQEIHVFYT